MNSEKSVVKLAVRVSEGILVDHRAEPTARATNDAFQNPSATSDTAGTQKRIKYVIDRA